MYSILHYLHNLKLGKAILWCYLIWYVVITTMYFDGSPKLWINSLGISLVIGTGLVLSVAPSFKQIKKIEPWQLMRLYMMPFCVSSFSSLIKGEGFTVFLSPKLSDNLIAGGMCALFLMTVGLLKSLNLRSQPRRQKS